MLDFIRSRAQTWVAWVIVGLIIVPFALWGIGDYATGGAEDNVATINDVNISQREFQRAYYQQEQRLKQMLGENYDASLFEDQMRRSVLEGMISQELMVQTARDEGLQVGAAQLAAVIQSVSSFQEGGAFNRATYESTLKMQGQSAAYFESRVARDLLSQQLYAALHDSAIVTDYDVDMLLKLERQQREVSYVQIPAARFLADAVISNDDIESQYSASIDRYKMPEKVDVEYLELSIESLQSSVDISERALEEAYQNQKEALATPEQRRASHILIEIPFEASAEEKRLAEEKANDLLARLNGGDSFEALAREFSDDLGSSELGGDLGFFRRGDMVPEFDTKVFSMNVGEVSELVATEFGYHIIRLDEVEKGETPAFAEVKDVLLAELKQSEAERLYYDMADQLTNMVFEYPDNLEIAADELGLKISKAEGITRNGAQGILANPLIVRALFSDEVLKERLNSEPIDIGNDHLIVVRVSDYTPAQAKPLNAVRDEIIEWLTRQYAESKAQTLGEELLAKVESNAGFSALAEAFAVEWVELGLIERGTASVNRLISKRAFELPRVSAGEISAGTVSLGGDYAVVVVKSIKPYEADQISAADRAAMRQQLMSIRGNADYEAFSQGLREASSVVIRLEE
ncbi:MAG: SurA N-terminal domain-containing protein [Gammaproteobacteria bacterium]|nr:SurA N-terminal domain-containing protein [Gammaproteobacteria bacterium]MCF6229627.1 SurA N-terminal domain-containing protein [Gammaproteobacteria bacterium]